MNVSNEAKRKGNELGRLTYPNLKLGSDGEGCSCIIVVAGRVKRKVEVEVMVVVRLMRGGLVVGGRWQGGMEGRKSKKKEKREENEEE